MQGVPVSKASAIISKEWKNVKASEKKMKKYKDLYEEEKQRHEEVLQKYQANHIYEMEIISLHKKCNKKARHQVPLMIQGRKNNKSLKKLMKKRPPQEQEKKLKRPHSLKNHQSPQSMLIQTQMTQTMNKNDKPKKHQKPLSLLIRTQTMKKSLQ